MGTWLITMDSDYDIGRLTLNIISDQTLICYHIKLSWSNATLPIKGSERRCKSCKQSINKPCKTLCTVTSRESVPN